MTQDHPVRAEHFVTPRTVPWFHVGEEAEPEVLTLVLHGLGQRASAVARDLAGVVRPGQLVVVPEGLSRTLPRPGAKRVMASWSTREDAEVDLADNVAYLDALRAHLAERFRPKRWQLLGFSQGGLTVARWVGQRAHEWERVVLWAAPIAGDVDPRAFRKNLGAAELVVALGDDDPHATTEGIALASAALNALQVPWSLRRFPGAHEVPAPVFAEVTA